MKILYFSNDYCTHDYRFLSSIAGSGNIVFHVRLETVRRQQEDRAVPEGVEIIHWAGGRGPFHWQDVPRYVASLRQVIKRTKPDLIHAGPIQTCAFISVLTGFRPVLTMSWGFDLMEYVYRGKWWQWVTRFTLNRSTFFTSDAAVTRDRALEFGMHPERTIVFPWGVDLEHFSPEPRDPPLGAGEGFTFFCNRAWEQRYGVDILARAFVQAAQSRPEMRLILLAGGSQGHTIRKILQGGGVLERVDFGGQIPQKDLPRWYHMADVYVSPSHVDGSSVSLMEALACGLPCLVSDIPANKEWVISGENGWLFPDGNVKDLAVAMVQACDERKNLQQLGQKARETAEDRADWQKNFNRLLSAYQQAVRLG
ncbi:MAG: glycosyltransferase [Anaerolineales bacterium]|nr:glycosyltransferase [Anaerolineales bacterium]